MSSDKHREQHVQSFSVQSIRDRILPDPDATPEERIKTLCYYIERDYPSWRARSLPDHNLKDAYAQILLSQRMAKITLTFEVLPTKSPLVYKASLSFLDYTIPMPDFPTRSLHDQAINHCIKTLISWLEDCKKEIAS